MKETRPTVPTVRVGPVHYQILAGACLVLIFFAQAEQGLMLGNLLVVCFGLFGIVSKMRAAPLILLAVLAMAHVGQRITQGGFDLQPPRRLLQLGDLALAIGVVGYITASYRLQSLQSHILPPDPRQRRLRSGERGQRPEFAAEPQKRSAQLLTPHEIARFVLALPFWALLGQAIFLLIGQPWTVPGWSDRFVRLVLLAWLFILGLLVVASFFGQWRRRQMDGTAARVYLQDVLWRETRREQRRIFRWLAWRRLHERTQENIS